METVQIENNINFHRDIRTHAVININNAEYNSYMRQRQLLALAKNDAASQTCCITTMQNDIDAIKLILNQLINKDLNATPTTPQ